MNLDLNKYISYCRGVMHYAPTGKMGFSRIYLFSLLSFFLLFYPGQNYYQTLAVKWQEPKVRPLPRSISLRPAPYPLNSQKNPVPNLSAQAVILMDIPSAVVLYQKNPTQSLNPASTTKIMTALVALDEYDINQIIKVSRFETEGAQMGLAVGDQITVGNLLYGMLINSGNDAATVLANNSPGGQKAFIQKMNQKAVELSMENTHFTNVWGYSEKNHYMSALDLARLSTYALQNPFIAGIVKTKTADVPDIYQKKFYHLENVNELLGKIPGITGIKTGWTEEAGECLVASTERDGKKLVSVILGSTDRFGETAKLLSWGHINFTWQEALTTHQ